MICCVMCLLYFSIDVLVWLLNLAAQLKLTIVSELHWNQGADMEYGEVLSLTSTKVIETDCVINIGAS